MTKTTKYTLISLGFVALYLLLKSLPSTIQTLKTAKEMEDSEIVDSVGQVQNGLKQGTWKYFDRLGRTQKIQTFKNDTLHGEEKLFDNEGELGLHQFYKMGTLVDTSKFFVGGWLNSIEYRDSNGVLQGEFRVMLEQKLVQIGNYKDGEFHGTFKTFHEKTGKMKELYFYDEGGKTGTWVYFDEQGDTLRTENY
jgi:hypothetical protein